MIELLAFGISYQCDALRWVPDTGLVCESQATFQCAGAGQLFARSGGWEYRCVSWAVDDVLATVEDSTEFAGVDVLDNDVEIEGDPLQIASVSQPSHGEARIETDGMTVSYRPEPDFCTGSGESEIFGYDLSSGSQGAVAVTVACTNDPPVPVSNQSGVVREGSSSGVGVLSLRADDPDHDELGWSIVENVDRDSDGIFAFAISEADDRTIVLDDADEADREAVSEFAIQVTVTDGTVTSEPVAVRITVEDANDNAPVVVPGKAFRVDQDAATGTVLGVLQAVDDDVTPTTFYNWHIVSGNSNRDADFFAAFQLDASTGRLAVLDQDELALAEDFELAVRVSDGVNMSAPETVTVQSGRFVDLDVLITNGRDEVIVDADETWLVEVTNEGPSDAEGAMIEVMTTNLSPRHWTCIPGSGDQCTDLGRFELIDAFDLQAGSRLSYLFTSRVTGEVDQAVTLEATVSSFETELNPTDNTSVDQDLISKALFRSGFEDQ